METVKIDQGSGAIFPFYDQDTNILFLAGKGDGNVRYYEIADNIYPLEIYRSNVSAKGMCIVPKKGLNILGNETARLMKLTTNSVEPLSFFVPRKSEGFQEDLYPDSFAGIPSHTCDEWLAGSSKPPELASLNPGAKIVSKAVQKKSSFKIFF